MKLEDFTKDEIIAAIRNVRNIAFISDTEKIILRACMDKRIRHIQDRRDEIFETERKLLDELKEVSGKHLGKKMVDIPEQDIKQMTAIHKKIKQAECEQGKLDKQEREVFDAMTAKKG